MQWPNFPTETKSSVLVVSVKIDSGCILITCRITSYATDLLRHVNWIYEVKSSRDDSNEMDPELDTGFDDNLDEMLNVTYGNMGPNADARKFFRLVEDGKQPLYQGCKKFSRWSFLVKLYH